MRASAMRRSESRSLLPAICLGLLVASGSGPLATMSALAAEASSTMADAAFGPARGLTMQPRAAEPEAAIERAPDVRGRPPATDKPPPPQVSPTPKGAPVRLAALDGKTTHFSDLKPRESNFQVVRPAENPDLVWDPKSRDVTVKGDIVAYGVPPGDLAGIIDRTAAIRDLKQIATKAPQPIQIAPDGARHRGDAAIQIVLSEVAGRSAVVFNISGDGTIEMLYPIGSDPAPTLTATLSLPLRVREPFGSDQVVAITSRERMSDLERALLQFNRQQTPGELVKNLKYFMPADARLGSLAFFSTP